MTDKTTTTLPPNLTVVGPEFAKPAEPEVKAPEISKETIPEVPSGETVTVDKGMLQRLMDKLDKLEEKTEDLSGAADLGRLQRVQDARNKGKLMKSARVAMFEKKYVVGWKTVSNDVWIDHENKLHEDQNIQLYLYEGEGKDPSATKLISQKEFTRLTESVVGEVVRESKDDDGQTFQTVILPTGEKLEVSIVFLNK